MKTKRDQILSKSEALGIHTTKTELPEEDVKKAEIEVTAVLQEAEAEDGVHVNGMATRKNKMDNKIRTNSIPSRMNDLETEEATIEATTSNLVSVEVVIEEVVMAEVVVVAVEDNQTRSGKLVRTEDPIETTTKISRKKK